MSFFKNNWFKYIYAPNGKIWIVFIVITLLATSVLGYYTPIYIKELFSNYDNDQIYYDTVRILTVIFITGYIVKAFYQFSVNKYVVLLMQAIRLKSFTNWMISYDLIDDDQAHTEGYPLGEVLSRIMNDTEAIRDLITSGSFSIFIDITFIASCFIGFLNINTSAGFFIITAEVIAAVVLVYASKYMAKIFMSVRKATSYVSRVSSNLIGGIRQIYYTPNKNFTSTTGTKAFEEFLAKQLRSNVWDASYFSVAESLYPLLVASLVFVLPYSNIIDVAVFAALLDLIQRSISPIKEIASKVSSLQRSKTGIIRLTDFNEHLLRQKRADLSEKIEAIDLKELKVNIPEFSYPNTSKDFKLTDIHFSAKMGELVGIVGASGCGKSTLLKILSANIISKKAHILITDQRGETIDFNISSIDSISRYRKQVSIVSQDSHVFTNTLGFNISFEETISDHLKSFYNNALNQVPYIKKWAYKLEDPIDPKSLSLGQKQLISALRACYQKKPIVFFDEISSGLDSELEEALRKLVLIIGKRSLTFIVAHRVETIIQADKIFVMQNGKIVDSGDHKQLLKDSRVYQSFINELSH